jgi:hypothetical protein
VIRRDQVELSVVPDKLPGKWTLAGPAGDEFRLA